MKYGRLTKNNRSLNEHNPIDMRKTVTNEDGKCRIIGYVNGLRYETGWFSTYKACKQQADELHSHYRNSKFCVDPNGNLC